MIDVELPDGRRIRVNTDDPQAASAAARKYLQKGSDSGLTSEPQSTPMPGSVEAITANMPQQSYAPPTPAAPPEPRKGPQEGIARGAQITGQGVGSGIAHLLGMPADLISLAGNLAVQGGAGAYNLFVDDENEVDLPWVEGKDIPGTSESIKNLFSDAYEVAGGETIPYEQMSGREKLGYNVVDYGTQALTGGAALAKKAGERAVTQGLKPSRVDKFLAPYVKAPGRTIAGDVAAGAGSGAGVSVAEEYFPDSPTAQLVAAFLGGSAGNAGLNLARTGGRGARTMLRGPMSSIPYDKEAPLDRRFVTNKVADKAAKVMQEETNIQPGDIGKMVGEYTAEGLPTPTTGTGTGDLGALGIEQSMRRSNPKPFIESDEAAKAAATEKVRSVRPEGVSDADLRAPQRFAEEKAAGMKARAQGAKEMAGQRLEEAEAAQKTLRQEDIDLAAPVAAEGKGAAKKQAEAGKTLDRVITDETLDVRTKEKNVKFEESAKAAGRRDVKPIAKLVTDINKKVGELTPESSGVPAEFAAKLKKLTPKMEAKESGVLDEAGAALSKDVNVGGPGTVDMKSLQDVRKYLGTAARGAQQKGNYELADNIRELKKGINDEIDKLAKEGGPGSAEAAAAQKYYKEEYAPYFGEGFGRKFRDEIQRQGKDRTELTSSQVADWWLGGNPPEEKLKDLKRILSVAPGKAEGEKAIKNYLAADMAGVVHDGAINPKALNKWIDNNSVMLNEFPDIKKEVTALQKAALNNRAKGQELAQKVTEFRAELGKATQNVADIDKAINNSALSIFLNNSPESSVRKVLAASGDPEKRMDDVLKLLDDAPPAMRGQLKKSWNAAIADHLIKKVRTTALTSSGEETISYAALVKQFRDNEKVLAKTMGPKEMNSLRQAHKVLEPLGKLTIRAGKGGSDTAEMLAAREKVWNRLESGLRIYYGLTGNVIRGGGVTRSLKLLAQRVSSNDEPFVARLVERAMLDPEVAQHLLQRDIKAIGTPSWNKKLNRLLGYGAAAREAIDTDEEEE